jgi:membrane-associated phospholipid phosphatase
MKTGELITLIIGEVLLTLAVFSAIIALIVFSIRNPIRRHKPIDMEIFEKIQPMVNTTNNKIMSFITFLGKHQFLIPANLILIFYFIVITKQNWFTIRVITIAVSSLVLMLLLKQLFQRKRPLSPLLKAAKGLSFPSGHAIMAVTFYGLLIYIIQNSIASDWLKVVSTLLLVILIFFIGFSRVYLRVHYASDVASGFIIGTLWLLISLFVLKLLESYVKSL